mgnify:CR=1 FL=1
MVRVFYDEVGLAVQSRPDNSLVQRMAPSRRRFHDDAIFSQRLGQLLEDHADLPPEELRERVLREVRSFADGAPQHDDMTMILLRVEELPQLSVTTINAELAELAEG